MGLDRSRLTTEERGELVRALLKRRQMLRGVAGSPWSDRVVSDARWRLYVVDTLLDELGDE